MAGALYLAGVSQAFPAARRLALTSRNRSVVDTIFGGQVMVNIVGLEHLESSTSKDEAMLPFKHDSTKTLFLSR